MPAPKVEPAAQSSVSADLAVFRRVLDNERTMKLLTAAGHDYLTDPVLERMIEGSGLSVADARATLETLMRPLGVLGTKVGDVQYWLFMTAEIRRCLHRIDMTCTAGSELAVALSRHPAAVVSLNVQSAIASARLDGIEIDPESARELLLLTRRPRTVPERVVANSRALYEDIVHYAERVCSVEGFLDLYARLTEGIPVPDGWLDAPRDESLNVGPLRFATAREVLDAACSMTTEDVAAYGSHAAIVGSRILNLFLIARPFPILNGTVGRLAQHIYAVESGYPLLGIVPYASVYADWMAGAIGRAEGIGGAYIDPTDPAGSPWHADITRWATRHLQLLVHAVERVRHEVQTAEREFQSLVHLQEVDPELNRRQRAILGRALDDPAAEFRIAYHRTANNIAYSTARADLEELEAKGLLVRLREGNAFKYRAADDLASKLKTKA